jgi:hypothetical protein
MAHYRATVPSTLGHAAAFDYMARFENVAEWDPSILGVRVEPPGADPGVGNVYVVTIRFGKEPHDIRYRMAELEPPGRIVLTGEAPRYRVRDEIIVAADGGGSRVTYDATVMPKGLLRLAGPIVQRRFTETSDAAIARLRQRLNP